MTDHQLHCSWKFVAVILFSVLLNSTTLFAATPPPLPLANSYKSDVDITSYWVSEKLDGVRAYWNGKQLLSKQGHPYMAPEWFTEQLPNVPMDGELWTGRGQFEALVSTVTKYQPDDEQWQNVRYMVFDLPHESLSFSARLKRLEQIVERQNTPYLVMVEQLQLADSQVLMDKLDQVMTLGGEGRCALSLRTK